MTALAACYLPSSASAQSLDDLGLLPGGTVSVGYGISADGSVVVGYGNGAGFEAFRWTSGAGMSGLGFLPGGTFSKAVGVNADGSVVVGVSENSGAAFEAFRWSSGAGMVGLGFLSGGTSSQAAGVNADGSVVVGYGDSSGASSEAFRWTSGTGMVGLGFLSGGTSSQAAGVNADGSVVVGYGAGSGTSEAFRWTSGTGMVGLGFMSGGTISEATGVNADGSVVVGAGDNSSTGEEAFRWTSGTGMVGLGLMSGGTFSHALGVNADGSVVVGYGDSSAGNQAFHWSSGTGMVSVLDSLAAEGVDVSNWSLENAASVSADGSSIVGFGTFNGSFVAYLANLNTGGLATPQDLSASLNSVGQASQQIAGEAMAYLPQSLYVASHLVPSPARSTAGMAAKPEDIGPAAGGDSSADSNLSFFALGSYGRDDGDQFNGVAGVTRRWTDEIGFGVGLIAGSSRSDLMFDGESDADAKGVMLLTAYEPMDSGLRLYGSVFAAGLSADIKRGYMNGSAQDFSHGETDGHAYGAAARLGWQETLGDIKVMPYAEARYSHTALDAYTEKDGGFPAEISEQDSTHKAALIGVELERPFVEDIVVTARLAGGHRFGDGGDSFTAETSGLTQSVSWSEDNNWGEGSLGVAWQATPSVRFGLEATGRTGDAAGPDTTALLSTGITF